MQSIEALLPVHAWCPSQALLLLPVAGDTATGYFRAAKTAVALE